MRRKLIAAITAATIVGLSLPNTIPVFDICNTSYAYYDYDYDEDEDEDEEDYEFYMDAPEMEQVRHLSDRTMLTLVWKTVEDATGYQIQYTQNGKYSKSKTINTDENRSATIRGLKKGKDVKIRIRACNNEYGVKNYSDWTEIKVKTVKGKNV